MKLFKKLKEYFKKNLNFSSSERALYRCEGTTIHGEFKRCYVTADSKESANLVASQNYPEVLNWEIFNDNN
jgi:hypothetical protein